MVEDSFPNGRPPLEKAGVEFGKPESLTDQLKPLLSNPALFGSDLYEAGLGEKIEEMVREELAGEGAVRAVLRKYLSGENTYAV